MCIIVIFFSKKKIFSSLRTLDMTSIAEDLMEHMCWLKFKFAEAFI